ncbi:hypothetical protein QYF61_014159 [Mycteria americana]|uniref:Uncharacterized protein n=1 Tax=Mycteria americana TaxID=33587 RepID=A0AAN7N9B0_MYCAM|nr:hypothetical protein QYF61_014159 [Mycteria americana]
MKFRTYSNVNGDFSRSSPAPAWGPSHGRQSSMNFSNMSPSHGLQFFMNCSSVGPFHGVQSFRNRLEQSCQQTCSSVVSSLHVSTGPARSLLQRGLSKGSQPPLGHIHLLQHGVLYGLQVDICSTVDLHAGGQPASPWSSPRAAGESLLRRWSTSSPSFFTGLGVCGVVSFTYSHSSLWLQLPSFFPPLLKYVITEVLPPSLMGLALASSRSALETAGISSMDIGEASSSFSQKPPLKRVQILQRKCSFKLCPLVDKPIIQHDLNSLLSCSNMSSFNFSISKCNIMHLGTVSVAQIVRLRDCTQDSVASGKDFRVILSNQPTMNSLCKALAMRTHMLRGFMKKELSFGN